MRYLLGVSLLAALTLPLVADRARYRVKHTRTPEMQQLLEKAHRHLTAAEYPEARATYLKAQAIARPLREFDKASILIGLGNCEFFARKYDGALRYYKQAAQVAESAGLLEHQAIVTGNLAGLYRRMADSASALRLMRTVERLAPYSTSALFIAQVANVNRDIAFDRSMALFAKALDVARQQSQPFTESLIWNQIGMALEDRGRFRDAERAYTEAFRIRALNGRKNLQPIYFYLGRVKTRLGEPDQALALLERARHLSGNPEGQIQLPYLHHALARAYESQNEMEKALAEYEAAIHTMQEWRLQVLPAESFQISAENESQMIFSDYIAAGMRLASETDNKRLAAHMLTVAENSRNWLFQEKIGHGRTLPPAYLEALARYRRLLAQSLDETDRESAQEAEKQRLVLAEMEAGLGIRTEQTKTSHKNSERVPSDNPLVGVQRKLKSTEAFLSFHAGADAGYVWAVTDTSFEVHRLAPRRTLQAAIRDFRTAVQDGADRRSVAGERLSHLLLGALGPEVRRKPEWVLSLDGPLFDVPFAALPDNGRWMAENRAVRLATSAWLGRREADTTPSSEFVAFADPVYNRADSRLRNGEAVRRASELPRLPGTEAEVRACARAWGRDPGPEVRTGADVGRERVVAAAANGPAVLHIAAHFVPHPAFADEVLIALGVRRSGDAEYLGPSDIAFQRMRVGLVTLSGCSSGSGASLPGLGIFGLTRAWLTAGANAVVASHWPIADDTGGLLAAMYERLGQSQEPLSASRVAEALHSAQLRMIASGGWRSKPVYWSAFEVIGKE